jgi:Mn-dependent DtxR family transcriptional regulator
MNLAQSELLLCEQTQEYLKMLYRQSKITGSVQINFLAAKLDISTHAAEKAAQFLQQTGFIVYEKYGRVILTEEGKRYARSILYHEKTAEPLQKKL